MVIGRLRGEGWGRVVRVLAPVGAFVVEGWPALLGALLVQEGGVWLAGRLSADCQRTFARRLFLAAYALRVVIALPTHYLAKLGDGNGALFQDDYTNDLVGEWLVRIARGDGVVSIFPGHQYLLDSVYSYVVMAMYAFFGYAPLLPKLLNIGLAGLSAVLIFEIARNVFSTRAAVLAAIGAAVLPTFVVWSVATLKETLVLFASLIALWLLRFVLSSARGDTRLTDALVALFGVELLLLDLRATTAAILAGLVPIVLVARARVARRSWQAVLVALVVVGLLGTGAMVVRSRSNNRPVSAVFEDVALQIRHRRAQEAASARSQLRPEVEVLSPTGSGLPAAEAASDAAPFTFVGDVLDPLGYALLAPAPWQAESNTELAASAEMPIWYVLLAASLLAWPAAPRPRLFVGCLIVYAIANWLILAAVEGNLGNLLRHRLTLDACLLILGAAGLEWAWVRLSVWQVVAGLRIGLRQPLFAADDAHQTRHL